MPRLPTLCLAALLLTACAGTRAARTDAPHPCPDPEARTAWQRIRAAHLVLRTDLPPERAEELARGLEAAWAAQDGLLGPWRSDVTLRLSVAYALEGLALPEGWVAVPLDASALQRGAHPALGAMAAARLAHAHPALPAWLRWGLTDFLGALAPQRSGDVRAGRALPAHVEVLQTRALHGLDVLAAADAPTPSLRASAWAWVHFLLGVHTDRVVTLLRASSELPFAQAWELAFAGVSAEALEAGARRHVAAMPHAPASLRRAPGASLFELEALSPADVHVLHAQLRLAQAEWVGAAPLAAMDAGADAAWQRDAPRTGADVTGRRGARRAETDAAQTERPARAWSEAAVSERPARAWSEAAVSERPARAGTEAPASGRRARAGSEPSVSERMALAGTGTPASERRARAGSAPPASEQLARALHASARAEAEMAARLEPAHPLAAALRAALAERPEAGAVLALLARLLQDEARGAVGPELDEAWGLLLAALERTGAPADRLAPAFLAASRRERDSASLAAAAAWLAAHGHAAEALAAAERADALRPDDAEVLGVLARALAASGRCAEARAALERARLRSPPGAGAALQEHPAARCSAGAAPAGR